MNRGKNVMPLTYKKHEKIWLKDHPEFAETWVRDRIVEDPTILGLAARGFSPDSPSYPLESC
jgi:hypothetical protein